MDLKPLASQSDARDEMSLFSRPAVAGTPEVPETQPRCSICTEEIHAVVTVDRELLRQFAQRGCQSVIVFV